MTPLCVLAEKYLTDKGPKFHGYTKHYFDAITKYLDSSAVQRVGEIGIGHFDCMCHVSPDYKPGASLRMWSEFFPEAEVYGYDIDKATLFSEGNINCKFMDQSSEESMRAALSDCSGEFDIIIDDGSHVIQHQVITKYVAGAFIKTGGLLIIEDIEERFLDYWFSEPPPGFECVAISQDDPMNNFVIYRRLSTDA